MARTPAMAIEAILIIGKESEAPVSGFLLPASLSEVFPEELEESEEELEESVEELLSITAPDP